MGTKVESYLSDDGKLFKSEQAMLEHEAQIALFESVPRLKDREQLILDNLSAMATILKPLADFQNNHPATAAEDHPETRPIRPSAAARWMPCQGSRHDDVTDHGELAGTCDCSAGMSGASDHAVGCPSFRPLGKTEEVLNLYVDDEVVEASVTKHLRAVNGG